jgi:hypothetical protein
MIRVACGLLLSVTWAGAQSGLTVPLAAVTEDVTGRPMALYGGAGSLVASSPSEPGRVWHGGQYLVAQPPGGGRLQILSTAGEVLCSHVAPPGPARFGFSPAGDEALAWFEEAERLVRIRGCLLEWVQLEAPAPGHVVGLASPARGRLQLVVRSDAGLMLLVYNAAGGLENETLLVGVTEPLALLRDGSLAFAEGETLVVRRLEGAESRVDAGARIVDLAEMGPGWIRVKTVQADRPLAARVRGDEVALYCLPEAAP